MLRISVITCTHNPREAYLNATIAGLRLQTLPVSQWEYLLVDNASAEERRPRVDLSWHSAARTMRETQLGLTAARLRGIREASGDLLVFVDDDNVLAPGFLAIAAKKAAECPHIGAFSGQCHARFETPPESWTRPYWGNLVVREFRRDRWSNLPHLPETMPCGAGLCVRRDVAAEYLRLHEAGARAVMLDRTGQSLLSGGDNDLAACACDVGLGVGLFADLHLDHLIPSDRTEADYLVRLAEGIAFSGVVFRSFRDPVVPPARSRAGRIADLIRLARMTPIQRQMFQAWQRGEQRAKDQLAAAKSPPMAGPARPQ